MARRRSKSIFSGGGGGSDTALAIVALGGMGILGYFLFTSRQGVDESLKTFGQGLKNATDAINSSGGAIGGSVDWLTKLPSNIWNAWNGPGNIFDEMGKDIERERDEVFRGISKSVGDITGSSGPRSGKSISEQIEDAQIGGPKAPIVRAGEGIWDIIGGLGCGVIRTC